MPAVTHKVLVFDGMTQVHDYDLSGLAIAYLNSAGGVVGSGDYAASLTGSLAINVASGRAWLPNALAGAVTNMYGTYLNGTYTLSVASNTASAFVMDYVVLYVNITGSPTPTGDNIPQIVAVRGTGSATNPPPAPTTAQIQASAVGSNPYLVLASYIVPQNSNPTTLVDMRTFSYFTTGQVMPIPLYEEFTDQAVAPGAPASGKTRLFSKGASLFLENPAGGIAQIGSSSVIANGNSGATPQVDWSQGITQAFTLTGSTTQRSATFTFTNPVAGEKLTLILTQDANDATYGAATVVWPANVIWPNNVAPVLSTTSGQTDLVGFIWDGTYYRGVSSLSYPH